MALDAGRCLGPYEIVAPLGAGGMGEVYRAKDPRLGREVAIKVLPAEVAGDAERLRRFEQEARAASALNHPNILTVHDFGAYDGVAYLVTELLSGESLRDLLRKGPLTPKRAIEIGIQVAHGLAAAHGKGIVHRDLKPENLFLTRDGVAKILDFGLARLLPSAIATTSDLDAAPLAAELTRDGGVFGTVGYMAPEQVRGQKADSRSDLFALGIVLYEMLAGVNPFRRESMVESLSSILKEEPPELQQLESQPPALGRIVARLLDKDPARRFLSASDLAFALETLGGGSLPRAGEGEARRARTTAAWRRTALVAFALVAACGLAGGWLLWRNSSASGTAPQLLRFDLEIPDHADFYSFTGPAAISPDGRNVVFAVYSEGHYLLALRSLDGDASRLLAGTDGAQTPFWSADGRSIGYAAHGKLCAVDLDGGPPREVCDAAGMVTGAWGPDGTILFGGFGTGLQRVPAAGGKPEAVTTLDPSRGEFAHLWPSFLPDGRRFLFLARSAKRELSRITVGSLDGVAPQAVVSAESNAVFSATGHLLFARQGRLVAQRFDLDRLELAGEPAEVARQVWQYQGTSGALFSISDNGILVFASSESSESQLSWLDRAGRQLGTVGAPGEHLQIELAPDERAVIDESLDPTTGNGTLWLHDLTRRISSRFSLDADWYWQPHWSPDGRRIAFAKGLGAVVVETADAGSTGEVVVAEPGTILYPSSWSADGKSLVLVESGASGNDLYALPLAGDRQRRPLLISSFDESQATVSPDGGWIAYTSNESGRLEVLVRPFPVGDRKWQISAAGGSQPRWRRDGRELFYLAPDRKLMAVAVRMAPTFTAAPPEALFATRARRFADRTDYAVTADGQRFLVNSRTESAPSPRLHVVAGWPQLLPADDRRP